MDDRINQEAKTGVCDNYQHWIIDMVGKIESPKILIKIFMMIKSHLLIIREKKPEYKFFAYSIKYLFYQKLPLVLLFVLFVK